MSMDQPHAHCCSQPRSAGSTWMVNDWMGYDWVTYDWTVYDWVTYDWTGYDSVMYDWTGYDSVMYDWTVYNSVTYDWSVVTSLCTCIRDDVADEKLSSEAEFSLSPLDSLASLIALLTVAAASSSTDTCGHQPVNVSDMTVHRVKLVSAEKHS